MIHRPVSYTHLDVYKRQIPKTLMREAGLFVRKKWTVLKMLNIRLLKKSDC